AFVGKMRIKVDQDIWLTGFYERAVIVFLSGVIRNMLLSGILLVVFHFLITKPVVTLAIRLSRIRREDLESGKFHVASRGKQDEIDLVANTINALSDRLNNAYHDLLIEIEDHKQTQADLEMLNLDLENRVNERTLALQELNVTLEKNIVELKNQLTDSKKYGHELVGKMSELTLNKAGIIQNNTKLMNRLQFLQDENHFMKEQIKTYAEVLDTTYTELDRLKRV
ncbi:MAG: hypothetical protein MI892_00915, partial [Desulfobacterales bacterium]|nr:hypothetical protein [Desulfobacterales bacterium]